METNQNILEENKSVIKRYWNGKWNERRPEVLDELQTKDVVYHGSSETMNGIEAYKQAYSSYLAAFQDTHIEIKELIAEGDLVMSRIEMHGVHEGELGGIPPTHNDFNINGFTIFRLVDGRIAEE
ncbi:ester cyclase [Carboxylicivirga marina]|uniref:ester cyclase n=1 Tax=Carboxylicivirga marina TaxID=2800988 RepID=UPI00259686C4|nr:ester cyclase [uncultured Carboxylicivirga sp.]